MARAILVRIGAFVFEGVLRALSKTLLSTECLGSLLGVVTSLICELNHHWDALGMLDCFTVFVQSKEI